MGQRILLSAMTGANDGLVIPIILKPYENKNFDVWSQCGDVAAKVAKDGIHFKLIDRTSTVPDLQNLKVTLNQLPSPDISPISTSGCFFLNRDLSGKIEVTDSLHTVYGEQAIPEKRIQNVLYPIYIGPAPTSEENCRKKDIRCRG